MMSYLHTKFHDNWISSFRGVVITRFWDGRTDGRTDRRSDCTPWPAFAFGDAGKNNENICFRRKDSYFTFWYLLSPRNIKITKADWRKWGKHLHVYHITSLDKQGLLYFVIAGFELWWVTSLCKCSFVSEVRKVFVYVNGEMLHDVHSKVLHFNFY